MSDWQTATTTFSSMLRDECRLIIWSGDSGEITVDDVCVTLDSSENIIKNGGFENLPLKNENIYIVDIGANIGWYSFFLGKYGYNIP